MPTRVPPLGAIKRTCTICGHVTRELTDNEWRAKQPIHEMSRRHQREAALKLVGSNSSESRR